MRPIKPGSSSDFTQVMQSLYRTFCGNIGFGSPDTFDPAGNGKTFSSDNMSGVIVRVGSIANPLSLPNFWSGNNTATVIKHNLNRKPIGFIVFLKDRSCDVYNGSPLVCSNTTITLYNTIDTADVVLFIF